MLADQIHIKPWKVRRLLLKKGLELRVRVQALANFPMILEPATAFCRNRANDVHPTGHEFGCGTEATEYGATRKGIPNQVNQVIIKHLPVVVQRPYIHRL